MPYKVDSQSLLFDRSMAAWEAKELEMVSRLALEGRTPLQHPAVRVWLEAVGVRNPEVPSSFAQGFAPHALLSLVQYWRSQTETPV